jgi:hypothetical protein
VVLLLAARPALANFATSFFDLFKEYCLGLSKSAWKQINRLEVFEAKT